MNTSRTVLQRMAMTARCGLPKAAVIAQPVGEKSTRRLAAAVRLQVVNPEVE